MVHLVTLVLATYFGDIRFSSNEGQVIHFLLSYLVFINGLILIINNSIQRVMCETNSLEVLHILQHLDHWNTHVYASLLIKIFGLNDKIPNISFNTYLERAIVVRIFW